MCAVLAAFILCLLGCYLLAAKYGNLWGFTSLAITLIMAACALRLCSARFHRTDVPAFHKLTSALGEYTRTGIASTLLVAAHPSWSEARICKRLSSLCQVVLHAEELLALLGLKPIPMRG